MIIPLKDMQTATLKARAANPQFAKLATRVEFGKFDIVHFPGYVDGCKWPKAAVLHAGLTAQQTIDTLNAMGAA